MEITIKGKPIIKATLDLAKFKQQLKNDWDIEKAVRRSIKVTYSEVSKDKVIETIHLQLDWGDLIDVFPHRTDKTMDIIVVRVEYKDWTKYEPEMLSGKTIKLNSEKVDGNSFIVLQTLIPSHGFAVKNFLAKHGFNYGDKKWKFEINGDNNVVGNNK